MNLSHFVHCRFRYTLSAHFKDVMRAVFQAVALIDIHEAALCRASPPFVPIVILTTNFSPLKVATISSVTIKGPLVLLPP